MRGKNTIVINGKVYDTLTGLPVAAPDPMPKTAAPVASTPPSQPNPPVSRPKAGTNVNGISRRPTPHKQIHRSRQKSATLRRDVLKKPNDHQTPVHQARPARRPAAVERSGMISKFAAHPQPLPVAKSETKPAAPVAPVPAVVKQAHHKVTKPAAPTEKLSSRALKEKLIAERLERIDPTVKKADHKPKHSLFAARPRVASVMAACFAVVILGGYFTYLNMPGLSVKVAATQAGIEASFPEYRPDGYRLNGPVAFGPGQISLKFKSNGGPQQFVLNQQASSWDSQAVLDNYVEPKDTAYVTSSEQGLTIYTFGSGAAWVNGGILYTIEGDAPLTTDQVLRMAASL